MTSYTCLFKVNIIVIKIKDSNKIPAVSHYFYAMQQNHFFCNKQQNKSLQNINQTNLQKLYLINSRRNMCWVDSGCNYMVKPKIKNILVKKTAGHKPVKYNFNA